VLPAGFTTPAGGRPEPVFPGPTVWIKLKTLDGRLSWLILPLGSTTTPRYYVPGVVGSVTGAPVNVIVFGAALTLFWANVL